MIAFRLGRLEVEPPGVKRPVDTVTSVVTDFEIDVDGECLFSETSFPVIELAGALLRWKSVSGEGRCDFEFESMDFEEPGLMWIRREGDGWRVGSLLQEFPDLTVRSADELDRAIDGFVADLERAAREELGLRLGPVWRLLSVA